MVQQIAKVEMDRSLHSLLLSLTLVVLLFVLRRNQRVVTLAMEICAQNEFQFLVCMIQIRE